MFYKKVYVNTKVRFLNRLVIIVLKPQYVNFMRYGSKDPSNINKIFTPVDGATNFNKEDLDFENYSEWVYDQIDPNTPCIAIGLEQGSHFAKYFVNRYSEICSGLIILNDRIFTKENYTKAFHSQQNYDLIKSVVGKDYERYIIENITNETIHDLLDKITSLKNPDNYVNLLNGICKGLVRSQYDKISDMKVKTIIYSDVENLDSKKLQMNKQSNDLVTYVYIFAGSQYPFYGKYCDQIIESVKGLICGSCSV